MVIGVDIGGTNLRTALVDGDGTIVQQSRVPTESERGADATARRLILECRSLVASASRMGTSVSAVGLGVAGKIDRLKGEVLFSPNLPAMRNYPLARMVQEDLKIPVFMENDANAFGIGENWMGAGRGIANWMGITLGTGVGGCLILGGKLWPGDDLGFVGEIGHTIVQPNGPRCTCGMRGCLEAHASGSALLAGVREAAAAGLLKGGALHEMLTQGTLTPEAVHRFAVEGDPLARELFHRMGWALGISIANAFTILGIRRAIIGGGVSAGWDQFIGPLRESLARHSSMLPVEQMDIRRGALGDRAAILGAAQLAWQGGF